MPAVITLSQREKAELRRHAARYTTPYKEVIRARIILMAAQGMQTKDIAGLDERPRPGRPPTRTDVNTRT